MCQAPSRVDLMPQTTNYSQMFRVQRTEPKQRKQSYRQAQLQSELCIFSTAFLPSQSSSMTRVESEVHEDQVTGASSLQCMPCAQEIDRINGIIVKGSPLVGKPHSSATYLDHQREALNLALENRAQEAVHIK